MSTLSTLHFCIRQAIFLLVYFSLATAIGSVNAVTIFVPDDFSTAQAAIDSAANGDTVILRPGTYFENLDFSGKAITLRSEQGPDVTIIDGGLNGSVVSFVNSEGLDSVLDGFTIINGSGTYSIDYPGYYEGAGIYCSGASPTIINNIIVGNNPGGPGRWTQGGGIACIQGASPIISRNQISDNTAFSGGAVYVRSSASNPTISRNLLQNNTSFFGGGINIWESLAAIECNDILGNDAIYEGGGIYLNDTPNGTIVTHNFIANNTSSFHGGGILCWNYSKP